VKADFANKVYERFCNPFIDHRWISITAQYTSKMKMRNMPLLTRHYEQQQTVPEHMALGFAGYLMFMKVTRKDGQRYYGSLHGVEYEITDDAAGYFYEAWNKYNAGELAAKVMADTELWDQDLTKLPGFLEAVQKNMDNIATKGALQTIAELEGISLPA
jgi:tagaturonate reductase